MKVFILFFITWIPCFLSAQEFDCRGSNTPYWLHSNNIRASFFPRGNKFTNENIEGQFLVPFNIESKLSTIFASSPWVGGFDDAGNLKIAFEAYPPVSGEFSNYSVGPLSSIGILYDSVCTHYDRAWSVYAEDIKAHRIDYFTDFKIDDTIASIFQWPARGNKHFKKYYGFDLPFDNFGLAPFRDMNFNDVYDPENGDYPIVFPHQSMEIIPDQILWMVFNDLSSQDEAPLRFEIQLTAFAYRCQENSWLNNTIFNRYQLINRAVLSADSVFFGMWTDYDLGCHEDDFVGSDSIRNTEFVYNDNNGDGNPGLDCPGGVETYGYNPPIQSMTYLSHPMHSFVTGGNENEPIEFYRKLNGRWNDNTPIYPTGEGYDPVSTLQPTRFLFHGDPRDENSWSGNNVLSEGKDYRTISSVNIDRMDPGAVRDVIIAYQFHHHPDSNYNGQLSLMYNNIDSLLNTQYLGENCSPFPYCTGDDCVWPGDFNNDGIADHFDYLQWSATNGLMGPMRSGTLAWRKQLSEDWQEMPAGINAKYADGDGNGIINEIDLLANKLNFLNTTDDYVNVAEYPEGNQLKLQAMPMDASGNIRSLRVSASENLSNILGLAFELEFDTSLYDFNTIIPRWPSASVIFYNTINDPQDQYYRYAAVQNDKTGIPINEYYNLLVGLGNTLTLKPGKSVPDSTILRLRNLIAIDPAGNDLNIGANTLVLYKEAITGNSDITDQSIFVYPNPVDDWMYIDIPYNVSAKILTAHGQVIKTLQLTPQTKVNVSDLSQGVYVLAIPQLNRAFKVIKQ